MKMFPVEDVPSRPCDLLIEKSQESVWGRHYSKARELLAEAACQCGETLELCLMRGDIFYTLERWQEARAEFGEVLKQAPRHHHAAVRLWFIDAIEKGFDDKAKEGLKNRVLEYLAQDPKNPDVLYAAVLGLDGAKAVPEKTKVIEAYSTIIKDPSWREDLAEIYHYDTFGATVEELPERARFFR